MAKKSNLNISKSLADKIPYIRCYEEYGIIETQNNAYTRGYEICTPKNKHKQSSIFSLCEIAWNPF